ncbi:hypothetical protein SUGI_0405390 [Cryptomeria japonica]|nr:hypothetical protein SUGI_0405390 [Cryptomeria japonica]
MHLKNELFTFLAYSEQNTHSRIASRSAQFAIFGPYLAGYSHPAISSSSFRGEFPLGFSSDSTSIGDGSFLQSPYGRRHATA